MVAFIIKGYYRGTETRTLYELLNSTTDVFYLNAEPIFYDDLLTDNKLIDIMPWMFDFDEPWKAPVHYPPAPRAIVGRSAQTRKPRIIYKQPMAGMGFKRGQRRIKQ